MPGIIQEKPGVEHPDVNLLGVISDIVLYVTVTLYQLRRNGVSILKESLYFQRPLFKEL